MKVMITINLFLCLSILACNRDISPKDLIGIYRFNINGRPTNDSLLISADKSYMHKFYTSAGKLFENSGTWEYDSSSNEIVFSNFVFFNNSGPANPPGYWVSKVEKAADKVALIYSDEEDRHYLKLNR